MKYRLVVCLLSTLSIGVALSTGTAAQTQAYRQTNLASDVPNVADYFNQNLKNSWGVAFQPGEAFFIANNKSGTATTHFATGTSLAPSGFAVPNVPGTGPGTPTGIVADPNSLFGGRNFRTPFILVTEDGGIFEWGPDVNGDILTHATLVANDSLHGAVYKGVVILNSLLTAPAVGVTDFHGGSIAAFLPSFDRVALPGSFTDPNLPAGYAPFGIQTVGKQVFVTYAVQDADQRNPVVGDGNGIVSIFDMDGNFDRRFATGGSLNAPWGIAKAPANFGSFSNDILVGNVGDGTISAFDPSTGNLLGRMEDGDGNVIVISNLHALTFRDDGFGDPNTLYFTAGIADTTDGLFGTLTPGLVSITTVSVPDTITDASVRITATVVAGPGNPGNPTGTVVFQDGLTPLGNGALVDGVATLDTVLRGVKVHSILALYSGNASFLASSSVARVQVAGLPTILSLTAPANSAHTSMVTLAATISSTGGAPTGEIVFNDSGTTLGTASLSADGIAALRINTLSDGAHSLTAFFAGDGKFASSTSATVTITVVDPDFSLGATPLSATVTAGQSTQFMLTVNPAGGFANNVTFSCSPLAGVTCSFSPAIVTPSNGAASTKLTVSTSANMISYRSLPLTPTGPAFLIAIMAVCGFAILGGRLKHPAALLLSSAAVLTILALSFTLGGCGGYSGATPSSRGTASIIVTAQAGAVLHTTTVQVTVQ